MALVTADELLQKTTASMVTDTEPTLITRTGKSIPQLAFGTYKVPADEEGERIISDAVESGYRHFDTASYYGNEETLGRALRNSGIPREDFYVCSKVWNDAQKAGRAAVRGSVENSLRLLDTECIDLCLIHWPVPGFFVATYKELEVLHGEGKIRSLGLSNFTPNEYEELLRADIQVLPEVNQFEVSPMMYRGYDVSFFSKRGVLVSASKALHRAAAFEKEPVRNIAKKYAVTPAQVMLRWGLQKGLIVVAKTATRSRMVENRSITGFSLTQEDMDELDRLTTDETVRERQVLELQRKTAL